MHNHPIPSLLTLLLLLTALPMKAQHEGPRQFEEDRARFMVAQAQISPADSATFFALYDEMQTRKRKLHDKMKAQPKMQPSTEDSCRAVILDCDMLDLQMKAVEQDYHARMLQALKPSLVFRLLKAEAAFYRQCFRKAAKKVK